MSELLVYYAHPAHRTSRVNRPMAEAARQMQGVEFVDLYYEYARHDIDVKKEQARLLSTDYIIFQFPLFWYSTPSILKDWQDLVLQYGFAYGEQGDKLAGKTLMLAITAAGPPEAYHSDGYQNYPIRDFLRPLEQMARLCQMKFLPPFILFSSLHWAKLGKIEPHVAGYTRLLKALQSGQYDFEQAEKLEIVTHETLPIKGV